jgi:hypothetical protein
VQQEGLGLLTLPVSLGTYLQHSAPTVDRKHSDTVPSTGYIVGGLAGDAL